ncbi:transmembrane protein 41A-like protein [Leptotrombidium deliense]|uniref:Transmembrane protein 41A-like protein n=1 Tax=Leptotrombidium deliense TaxID=299467 RepID=A0A443RXU6_9ACAR|nr:transmembrane protein 41A-like protein [Leptotrombidium deliense]
MPYNYVCVQTGCVLSQLTSLDDIFSFSTMCKLAAVATVVLIPGLVMKNDTQLLEHPPKHSSMRFRN